MRASRFSPFGDRVVERIKPDKAEFRAQGLLAQADVHGVGEKHFGAGEIDVARHESSLELRRQSSPFRRAAHAKTGANRRLQRLRIARGARRA